MVSATLSVASEGTSTDLGTSSSMPGFIVSIIRASAERPAAAAPCGSPALSPSAPAVLDRIAALRASGSHEQPLSALWPHAKAPRVILSAIPPSG